MQGCCRRHAPHSLRCVAPISPRKAWKYFSAFIFLLSGSPSCFALQVPDVKGLQDLGPPFLAQISLTQCNTYVHVSILDRGLVPKPFSFSQELQCNGS